LILAGIYFEINPSQVNFLPKCPLYATTGIYCPGCGSQRATHELLHGHIKGVLQNNVLYFLALLLLLYHSIVLLINHFFKTKYESILNYKNTPMIILIVILVFWILRNLPFEPFSWLAPH
jgi:hypothetical protein